MTNIKYALKCANHICVPLSAFVWTCSLVENPSYPVILRLYLRTVPALSFPQPKTMGPTKENQFLDIPWPSRSIPPRPKMSGPAPQWVRSLLTERKPNKKPAGWWNEAPD